MINQPKAANGILRFASNLSAVLTSDVLNRGTTFLIYIIVARQLGQIAFGQMSLALTLFYSFQVIAVFGLQTLITRAVAQDREHSGKYFSGGILVGTVASLAATGLMIGAVFLLDYKPETHNLIMLTSLGLFPFMIGTVCSAVIRGWEKMHLIAFVQVPVNLLKVVATVVALWVGGGIYSVVAILVASQFLIGLPLLAITVFQLRPWGAGALSLRFALSLARRSLTFVGIDTVSAWWASLYIVMLSQMSTEKDVALYNAVSQLMIPMAVFYQSVMVAAFPVMCRKFNDQQTGLQDVSNRLLELLLAMAVPGTVGLFLLAEPALELVYGEKGFAEAAVIVRIVVFILILRALTFALGHVLLAGSKETTTLRIITVDFVVGFVLGFILIGHFGLVGAAWAALLTRMVDFAQHIGPVRSMITKIDVLSIIWKPLLASAVMAVFLLSFEGQNLLILIAASIAIYMLTFAVMETWTAGGIRNLKARYQ